MPSKSHAILVMMIWLILIAGMMVLNNMPAWITDMQKLVLMGFMIFVGVASVGLLLRN